jgi:membrane associated rhomboid family serine protease
MSDFRYYRPSSFPPIVRGLIIINVAVFIAQLLLDSTLDLTDRFALWPFGTPQFQPYQIATHMFTHGSIGHIFFNMFALWMFGRELENIWEPKRFLFFYLICGVGAAVGHLAVQYLTGTGAPAVGASGAVMGVLVAYGYLFPNTQLIIFPIPFPVKAKWAVLGYVAIDLFSGVSGRGDNVAHFAHLGGALTGFILVLIWNKSDKKRFY